MAETSISWTTFTANPWEGCTEVSPGCDNCYAKAQNKWLRGGKHWSKQGPRLAIANWRKTILKAKRVAIETGHRVPVFVASIADIFEKEMPLENMEGKTTDDIRQEFFEVAERTKECTFLLLTKRAVNINKMIPAHWMNGGMPDNVWFGASVCTQEEADKHIPHLLAALGIGNKFLSMEPLLGPIQIGNWLGIPDIHHHEMCKERRTDLQIDYLKGDGDRRTRTNLENLQKAWIEKWGHEIEPVQKEEGGKDYPNRIFASKADGEWQKDKSFSPQIGLVPLPRQHSRRIDHQSQEWYQDGQQDRESGNNDYIGTGDPRNTYPEKKSAYVESGWGKEPFGKTEGLGYSIDNENEGERIIIETNRNCIWNSIPDSIKNSQGGASQISYVIVGGEATHKSKCRPMQPEWVNQIRTQCESNDVPFFFKQWGNYVPTGAKTIGGDEVMRHVKNPRNEELPYGSGIIVQRVPTKITAPLK